MDGLGVFAVPALAGGGAGYVLARWTGKWGFGVALALLLGLALWMRTLFFAQSGIEGVGAVILMLLALAGAAGMLLGGGLFMLQRRLGRGGRGA